MSNGFSLYLDLVRFVAACLVYMSHSNQRWLIAPILPASGYGHSAVVVFFVLSGFVITYITETRERDWISYAASRLSRVMSVVIPAILLTVLLDSVGRQLFGDAYAYPYDRFAARIVGSLLMLNEVWFVSITYFSNVPYWSITYELWYYAAFGLLTFIPGRKRWAAAFLLLLALGPKLLLLAPVWWAGVLLYRWQALRGISVALGYALAIGSTVGIIAFHAMGVSNLLSTWLKHALGPDLYTNLTFSKFFLGDYLLCLLVVCNFAGMRRVLESLPSLPPTLESTIRWLGSFTFSLYLMHQPLFLFWGSVLRGDPNGWSFWALTTALSMMSVIGLAQLTESRRYWLRKLFERWLRVFQSAKGSLHVVAPR